MESLMSGIVGWFGIDRWDHADYTGDTDTGTAGADTMYGGDYAFVDLYGGDGNDTYVLFSGADGNTIHDTSGIDTIHITLDVGDSYTIPVDIENLEVSDLWEGYLFVNWEPTDGVVNPDMKDMSGVTIHGNALGNVIHGSDLKDVLNGNGGNDYLSGGMGADTLNGGTGADTLAGGEGKDVLDGGSENDQLRGGDDADLLRGGGGSDTLEGGAGADTMQGGAGHDTYIVEDAGDKVIEAVGEGTDLVIVRTGSFDLGTVSTIENMTFDAAPGGIIGYGSELANTIKVTTGANAYIDGRAGFDVIQAGNGHDTLIGADGFDTLSGGWGNDNLRGDQGNDSLAGDALNDWLDGGIGNDILDGGTEHDVLLGGAGMDTLRGGTGNDLLTGGTEGDRLEGGAGRDTLVGGQGVDLLYGGANQDIFRFTAASDSTTANRDAVFDFEVSKLMYGLDGSVTRVINDRVDLSQIDANANVIGNQAFTWTGTGNFFKSAGDLWASASSGGTTIYGDTNGDAVADFELYLVGVTGVVGGTGLTSFDIIL
jgi:Ca2+-binding RTX toxin-like protein